MAASQELETDLRDGADQFVGYLLFDAWIGNTDRHHQNWAVLQLGERRELAPSYDHATSLGRELRRERVAERLTTRDHGQTVAAYARRARSAFHADSAGGRTIKTLAAYRAAATVKPAAASYWATRLSSIPEDLPRRLIERVPDELMSEPHRALAARLLASNRTRILDVPR